jgi:hypothetical protein
MSSTALYLELEYQAADFNRLAAAWQQVIDRHAILQSDDGKKYDIKLYDLSLQSADKILQVENKLRQSFLEFPISENQWPWFSIKATHYTSGAVRFYMSFAPNMLDAHQIYYLLSEWLALYQQPNLELKSLPLVKTTQPTPVNKKPFQVHYAHLYGKLDHHTLTKVRENSEHHHVSLPVVMLNLFASELHKQELNYPVHLSLINRFPFYPFMYDSAQFATSVARLAVNDPLQGSFVTSCQNLDQDLRQASFTVSNAKLDNFIYFTPEQNQFALFSCTLEQNFNAGPLYAKRSDILYCNFDLPTPMIDYNVWEQGGQLMFRWSYSKALPAINANLDTSLLQNTLSVHAGEKHGTDMTTTTISDKGKKALALGGGAALAMGAAGTAKAGQSKKDSDNKAKSAGGVPLLTDSATHEADVPMENAFNGVGSSLVTLGNSPETWQQDNNKDLVEKSSGDGTTEILNTSSGSTFDKFLDKIAPFSAVGLLAAAVAGLAATTNKNSTPDNPAGTGNSAGTGNPEANVDRGGPKNENSGNDEANSNTPPQAPTANDLANMSEPEITAAYDDFAKKVKKKHELPPKDQMLQDDVCAQYVAMAGELGPDALKVKDELSTMGAKVDSMSGAIASGDPKQIAAASGQLSESQLALLEGMDQQGLLDAGKQNPLIGQSLDIYNTSQNLDSVEDIQNLNDKVDTFDSTFSDYESKLSVDNAKTQATENLKEQFASSSLAAPLAASQNKATELSVVTDQFAEYNCQSITDAQATKVIDEMTTKAAELQAMIPPTPPNPIDEKIASTQAALSNFESTLAAKQAALTAGGQSPALGMQDPAVLAALENLNTQAADYAGAVNSNCPICSAADPNVPKIPNCGHNHSDVLNQTNPFQVPQVNLKATLESLLAIPQPSIPTLSAIGKLQGLLDRFKTFDPTGGGGMDFSNPIGILKEKVKSLSEQLITQHTALLNCPGYQDVGNNLKDSAVSTATGTVSGKKQEVESAIASLQAAQEKLDTLQKGSNPKDTVDKSAALKQSMQDAMTKGKGDAKNLAQQQADAAKAASLASAAAAVSQASICYEAVSIPAMQKLDGAGKADEVLVSGFQLSCAFCVTGQPQKVMVPPGNSMTIQDKVILAVNGLPLVVDFGLCKFPDPTKPTPCVKSILVTGGSTDATMAEFPIATLGTTQFKCGKGQSQKALDSGQDKGSEPMTVG